MNRFLFVALLAVSAAAVSPAFADDITADTTPFASSRTRAEVQAELVTFKKGPDPWATSFNPLTAFRGTKSRAEVVGEFQSTREEVEALHSEDSGSSYLSAVRRTAVQLLAGQSATTY